MTVYDQVELIDLPEIKLVALAMTSPFANHQPSRVEALKEQFHERKNEIRNQVQPERYLCPSFVSEVLFTYLVCLEVEDLTKVPDGMIGFAIPPHRYAKVKSKGDPYQVIHDHLKKISLESDIRALAFEVYQFANPLWPDEAEVFIPLK
jgi:predicted transcriptional regulator YdeE